jgi:hypothetical protein
VPPYLFDLPTRLAKDRAVDRQSKINQINSRSGRVSKVSNLEVNPTLIHSDYKVEPCDGILSETGNLEILKVVSKSGNGPYFIARWDQRPEHLDIDMRGSRRSAIKKFKANEFGYSGHHTNRPSDPDKRLFDIQIQTPLGMIFDGTVSFSNTYEEIIVVTANATMTCDAEVIRAGSKTEGA